MQVFALHQNSSFFGRSVFFLPQAVYTKHSFDEVVADLFCAKKSFGIYKKHFVFLTHIWKKMNIVSKLFF